MICRSLDMAQSLNSLSSVFLKTNYFPFTIKNVFHEEEIYFNKWYWDNCFLCHKMKRKRRRKKEVKKRY